MMILTPRKDMINMYFVGNVVNLDNKQVKVNSLDQHPTESCHQKVLHKGCYCNTGTLQKTIRTVRIQADHPQCLRLRDVHDKLFDLIRGISWFDGVLSPLIPR